MGGCRFVGVCWECDFICCFRVWVDVVDVYCQMNVLPTLAVFVSVTLWSVLSCYIGLWLELGTDLGVRFGLSRVLSGPWRELRRRGVICGMALSRFLNFNDGDEESVDVCVVSVSELCESGRGVV